MLKTLNHCVSHHKISVCAKVSCDGPVCARLQVWQPYALVGLVVLSGYGFSRCQSAGHCQNFKRGGKGAMSLNKIWHFDKRLKLAVWTLMFMACQPSADSQLDIDAGLHITPEQTNTAPGVVEIGGCTATAVSSSTLITAAHCIGGNRRVCIRSGTEANGQCTTNVFVPSNYQSNNYQRDIAVAIFESGTFKHYFALGQESVRGGDSVVMVGYSKYSNDQPDKGSKRWGANVVSELEQGDVIITDYRGNAEGVAVNPGDSGGPMFKACKLIGVTSRTNNYGTFNGKISLHTNVASPPVKSWLESIQSQHSAVYCGWNEEETSQCDARGLAQPIEKPLSELIAKNEFPCTLGGESQENLEPIYIALSPEQNPKLALSVPKSTQSVYFCKATDQGNQACNKSHDILEARHFKDKGSHSIFVSTKRLSSQDVQDHIFVAQAYDAQNKVIGQVKVKLTRDVN